MIDDQRNFLRGGIRRARQLGRIVNHLGFASAPKLRSTSQNTTGESCLAMRCALKPLLARPPLEDEQNRHHSS